MKKFLSLLIVTAMILAMIPIMSLSVSAAITPGPLKPAYSASAIESMNEPKDPDEEDSVHTLAGYYYDANGFHMESPLYTKTSTPFSIVSSVESFDITKNNDAANGHVLSCEFTVEKFLYDGGEGKDEWICIAISNSPNVNPGGAKYQDGWFLLIRGSGDGTAKFEPHLDCGASFQISASDIVADAEVPTTVEGKEKYSFYMDYADGEWTMTLNDVDVSAELSSIDQTEMFNSFKDKAYLNVITQTGYIDEENPDANKIEHTFTKFNGEVPFGDDSAEAVSDNSTFADIVDSSTVPANTPAVVWDSTKSCFSRYGGSNLTYTDNEDGTIHVVASGSVPNVGWGISKKVSYEASDFPIVAVLCKNVPVTSGSCYYCAGSVLAAENAYNTTWETMDYEYSDEWTMGFIDLDGMWEGRINALTVVFNSVVSDDEDLNNWDIGFIGCFRSEDEAIAYGASYLANLGVEVETEEATTEADTTVAEVETTVAEDYDITKAFSDENATTVVTETETTVAGGEEATTAAGTYTKKNGCGSVVGGFAVLGIVALAGVTLKKKH